MNSSEPSTRWPSSTVFCPCCPAVIVDLNSPRTARDHWLDRNNETRFEPLTVARLPIVGHLRLFVQGSTDAVADELADHAVAGRLGALLHRRANVPQSSVRPHGRNGVFKTAAGDLHQTLRLFTEGADAEGHCGIAVITVEQHTAVDAHQISILEAVLAVGDAVDDDVVDRGAESRRKAPIALEGRSPSLGTDHPLRELVQLAGGNARCGGFLHSSEHPMDEAVCLIHGLQLALGLEADHSLTHASREPCPCA